MESPVHISLAAERVGELLGLPVTNTLLASWLVMAILIAFAIFVGRRPSLIPGKIQNLFEALFEYVINYMEETLGTRVAALRFFPLIATIFLFIFLSNLLEFTPFFGALVVGHGAEHVPLLRSAATDLNLTVALALISVLVVEITGILTLGFLSYGSKFVNIKGGAIGFAVGLLELIGNAARLVSLSFRLFGNILAGEVLIGVVVAFTPYVVPLPFMLFETFIGLMQAAIFALLTLAFIKIAVMPPAH